MKRISFRTSSSWSSAKGGGRDSVGIRGSSSAGRSSERPKEVNREVARPPVAGNEKPSVNWVGESDVSGENVFVGSGGGGGKSFKSSPKSPVVNSFVALSSNVCSGSSGWAN